MPSNPTPKTPQEAKWLGEHGRKYSSGWVLTPDQLDATWRERVTGGVSRKEIVEEMLSGLPRDITILEVGCNVGNQLVLLDKLGFKHCYGVELLPEAVARANVRLGNRVRQGSALDLPFPDALKGENGFDLVMTCWCLSHIAPKDVERAANEIRRVAKRYIFCTENYAPKEHCTIKDYLWQRHHMALFHNVLMVRHKIYPSAKPHPAAPSHRKGCTDAFLLELPQDV